MSLTVGLIIIIIAGALNLAWVGDPSPAITPLLTDEGLLPLKEHYHPIAA